MNYKEGQYLYPPRPEHSFPPSRLQMYEEMGKFLAQPKLNGSCLVLFTNGKKVLAYNRRKQLLKSFRIDITEVQKIYNGKGWMCIVGEYMNKSKKDESGKTWNHKLAIFDILVHNNKNLIGRKLEDRQKLLDKIYTNRKVGVKPFLDQITDNVFMVQNIKSDFVNIYENMIKDDMYEGLVLKLKTDPLKLGVRPTSNRGQIKCRKQTKNYSF